MLFLERTHICAVCIANNHCELQNQAYVHGVNHFDLPGIHQKVDVDASHERFAIVFLRGSHRSVRYPMAKAPTTVAASPTPLFERPGDS